MHVATSKLALLSLSALALLGACGGDAVPAPEAPPAATATASASAPPPAATPVVTAAPAPPPRGFASASEAAKAALDALVAKDAAALGKACVDEAACKALEGKVAGLEQHLPAPCPASAPKAECFTVKKGASKGTLTVTTTQLEGRHLVAGAELEVKKEGQAEGVVDSKKGATVIMTQKGGDAPTVGQAGELFRQVDQNIPFIGGSWALVALVSVDKLDKGKVHVTVKEEKSQVTINGKKLDHFSKGANLRLKWAQVSQGPL